jgi:hypothetical protein
MACALGCSDTGGAHCRTVVPSNVPATLFVATGTLTIATDTMWNTSMCTTLPGMPMVVTQATGPELCVVRANRFEVSAGATLTVTGGRPLVVLAEDRALVTGTIDVSAVRGAAGPGGWGPALVAGTGMGSGGLGAHSGGYDDGGGGGGGFCGAGGPGGVGDDAAGGTAGPAWGASSELSPLRGGYGGGTGGTGASAGTGGAGGGALQLVSRRLITVTGRLLAGGGGGAGGGDGTPGDDNIGGGGGGGSGGAILLEAPTVTLDAASTLHANGGGGGGAAGCNGRGDAGDGQDGRDADTMATGGARGPSCSGGANYGGPGGAGGGTPLGGVMGASNAATSANGAGGGGGAGCILVRNASGMLATVPIGTSPGADPGFRVRVVASE